MLTPNSSQELQWSQFIENDHSCLFESASPLGKNFLAQNPIGIFSSFSELFDYLWKNPDLLELEDIGFSFLKSYQGETYIQLYPELIEIARPQIEESRVGLETNLKSPSKESFIKAVKQCQAHIKEGDIYQANISHQFELPLSQKIDTKTLKSFIYPRLRELNPAQYLAIAEFKDHIVFSSSPESLLEITMKDDEFKLKSSPIKGTISYRQEAEELKSPKELAEHIMIVDLIRNDLSKISQTGSVRAQELLREAAYPNLKHLISDLVSVLKQKHHIKIGETLIPDFDVIFDALFPGGSITGAPKIRSMQIIDELEDSCRELFTGSLGYYKFNQAQGEFNILIRSIFYNKKTGELSFNTGAGITSSSDPEQEYQETLLKAQKLIEVFQDDL